MIVVGIDQYVKQQVVQTLAFGEQWPVFSLLSFIHVRNEGAAFSLLSDASGWQRWAFSALAVGFSIFLIVELRKLQLRLPDSSRLDGNAIWLGSAYALILGGANGNLIDRLRHGYVVDFILVHWRDYSFAIFNLADSAIFLGAVLWIAQLVLVGETKSAESTVVPAASTGESSPTAKAQGMRR